MQIHYACLRRRECVELSAVVWLLCAAQPTASAQGAPPACASLTFCSPSRLYDCYAQKACLMPVTGGLSGSMQTHLTGIGPSGSYLSLSGPNGEQLDGLMLPPGVTARLANPYGTVTCGPPSYACPGYPYPEVCAGGLCELYWWDSPSDCMNRVVGAGASLDFYDCDHFGVRVEITGATVQGSFLAPAGGHINEMLGTGDALHLASGASEGWITFEWPALCLEGSQRVCGDYVPLASDSCWGRCGKSRGDAGAPPAGCSCSITCGYEGTCCPDVAQMCSGHDGTPPFPDALSYGAGTDVFVDGPTAQAFASQVDPAPESAGFLLRREALLAPLAGTLPGFTIVHLDGTSAQNERASCALAPNADWMWVVRSGVDFVDGDDVYASCKADFVRVPAALRAQVSVSGEYRAEAHGAGNGQSLAMAAISAANLAVLTLAQFEQTTGAMCAVATNGGAWQLNASADNDADAWCGARLLSWDPATGLRRDDSGPVEGSYYVDVCYRNPTVGYTEACWTYPEGQEREIDLGPKVGATHTRACFLTRVESERGNFNESAASVQCALTERADRIYLKAKASTYGVARCNARCLEYPTAQTWPPSPTLAGIGSSSPPAATDASVAGSQAGSGRLNLYRSPDGIYDRPLLYVPGFDPTNRGGALESMRQFGPLFRKLRDDLGFDIWVLKPSGGASVRTAAREVARAVVQAHDYAGFGGKVMVLSGSQGALDARVALATWEQGDRYQVPGDPEEVPGVAAVGALPVSLWVSLNGPQRGAAGSVAVQLAVNEIASRLEAAGVVVPPDITGMLASGPAAEMLAERLSAGCDALTEYCSFPLDPFRWLGQYTIRDADPPAPHLDLYFDPYDVEATCCNFPSHLPPGYVDTCVWLSEPHAGFYADVDARGVAGNGWPQAPYRLAVSHGSFSPQGCAHMPDPARCVGPAVFTGTSGALGGTDFATVDFVHAGHAGFCERNTTVHFALEPGDLAGGDLRPGSNLAGVDWGPIPEAPLHTLAGHDNFALTFVPTESALACPGVVADPACQEVPGTSSGQRDHVSCDAVCRAANRASARFDNVLSNPTDRNGSHAAIEPRQALAVMAYLYEFAVADADGYFGASNPFLAGGAPPAGERDDCNDAAAAVHPDAPEVCGNGVDDDCDGVVDEGCDATPPAQVTDLSALRGRTTVVLRWTAPGDDGALGTAAAYDLRVSSTPLTEATFAAATPVGTGAPSPAGGAECADQQGLARCQAYYYALKARDEAGNWSALSNVVTAYRCDNTFIEYMCE